MLPHLPIIRAITAQQREDAVEHKARFEELHVARPRYPHLLGTQEHAVMLCAALVCYVTIAACAPWPGGLPMQKVSEVFASSRHV